jgi:hypothetical protein
MIRLLKWATDTLVDARGVGVWCLWSTVQPLRRLSDTQGIHPYLQYQSLSSILWPRDLRACEVVQPQYLVAFGVSGARLGAKTTGHGTGVHVVGIGPSSRSPRYDLSRVLCFDAHKLMQCSKSCLKLKSQKRQDGAVLDF